MKQEMGGRGGGGGVPRLYLKLHCRYFLGSKGVGK